MDGFSRFPLKVELSRLTYLTSFAGIYRKGLRASMHNYCKQDSVHMFVVTPFI
jgi:hypothetical protein